MRFCDFLVCSDCGEKNNAALYCKGERIQGSTDLIEYSVYRTHKHARWVVFFSGAGYSSKKTANNIRFNYFADLYEYNILIISSIFGHFDSRILENFSQSVSGVLQYFSIDAKKTHFMSFSNGGMMLSTFLKNNIILSATFASSVFPDLQNEKFISNSKNTNIIVVENSKDYNFQQYATYLKNFFNQHKIKFIHIISNSQHTFPKNKREELFNKIKGFDLNTC